MGVVSSSSATAAGEDCGHFVGGCMGREDFSVKSYLLPVISLGELSLWISP